MVFHPRGIRQRFPGDPFLAEMAVESFAAAPMLDSSGRPMGLIVLMDQSPFRERELVESLLKIFSVRAATEMERLRAEWSSLELAPVSVPEVLAEASGAFQAAFPERMFRYDGPNSLPGVLGHREQLRQVFDNLLSNAVKYSPPESEIVLGAGKQGGELVVHVSDRGVGIPSEEAERIFDRFYRLDTGDRRTTKGIGLGLSLVKEIVCLHGGRVWVESTPGKGSCFYVALPVAGSEAPVLKTSPQAGN